MSKEEFATVKIPKVTANSIEKQPWFKLYHDLDDFVMAAVRHKMESWMRTGWNKMSAKKEERDQSFLEFLRQCNKILNKKINTKKEA